MEEEYRPDIEVAKILEKKYNLDDLSFQDAQQIIYDFATEILIGNDSIQKENKEKATQYIKKINDFISGKIDTQTLRKFRVEAIKSSKTIEKQPDKNIIEFITKGLFDEEMSMFNEYGAEMHFEMLLFTLKETEESKICQQFLDFLLCSPIMKKHESS
ncbi:hypothetical protein AVKW3434_22290 [Acidovorax sp. SUPP3434]|uniref:hypothetical protein n=1 Tax=Acidovorax sp. SUPP3434 TaxID=2920880 RepID=UPI0023DE5065|nr:hypothetical protein [Acidovorax sp. SUPP3434]GKT02169.1 hypothetical protein AVKW3434_22290 [Acidovorax sp. SUPP3434]